jgi:hypothetical protein
MKMKQIALGSSGETDTDSAVDTDGDLDECEGKPHTYQELTTPESKRLQQVRDIHDTPVRALLLQTREDASTKTDLAA